MKSNNPILIKSKWKGNQYMSTIFSDVDCGVVVTHFDVIKHFLNAPWYNIKPIWCSLHLMYPPFMYNKSLNYVDTKTQYCKVMTTFDYYLYHIHEKYIQKMHSHGYYIKQLAISYPKIITSLNGWMFMEYNLRKEPC